MSNTDKKPLIVAENVDVVFKSGDEVVEILKKCSFKIAANTFNIIYGPSGSGKSTLLNVLTGLQKPTLGRVLFEGKDIYQYSAEELSQFRAKQLGVVYQQNYWVNSLSVVENVAMPLFFLGYKRSGALKLAMNALQRVDMAPYAQKSPLILSGGEQQRVAIARSIVNDPLYIIADEPTGSLDTKNGDMIMALLQSYTRDLKCTVILVTHNMEYLSLGEHLLHLQDGISEEITGSNIKGTTDKLIGELKVRINTLARMKTNA